MLSLKGRAQQAHSMSTPRERVGEHSLMFGQHTAALQVPARLPSRSSLARARANRPVYTRSARAAVAASLVSIFSRAVLSREKPIEFSSQFTFHVNWLLKKGESRKRAPRQAKGESININHRGRARRATMRSHAASDAG